MKRAIVAAALCAALTAGPSSAAPEFRMLYPNGVPRAEISGDWRHSHYTVWRAPAAQGPFTLISDSDVLCLGPCFVDDFGAVPGRTYVYRFDLVLGDGTPVSFGPYLATISAELARPLGAAVSPNPGRGAARVTLFVAAAPGASVGAEATLFDLQGRRMSTLFRGALVPGATRLDWDGRADDGRDLSAGLYLLRVATSDGRTFVTRVVRSR